MKKTLISVYLNFKEMPFFLKLITFSCVASILFASAIFPNGNFIINGQEVSYYEFWISGSGPAIFGFAIVSFAAGIGFLLRKEWAKILYIISLFTFYIIIPGFYRDFQNASEESVLSLILFVPLFWYLYFKESVKTYFQVLNQIFWKPCSLASLGGP